MRVEHFFNDLQDDHPDVIEAVKQNRIYFSQETKFSKGANWDEFERSALHERWGIFMKMNFNDDNFSTPEKMEETNKKFL